MKKIKDWSSTNPGGWKTKKTVVQKHRVKALDGDCKCVEIKTEALCPKDVIYIYSSLEHLCSVLPAHERNSPIQIMQKKSGRLIDIVIMMSNGGTRI